MRYCVNCKRINAGHPFFCQFCGRSFDVRICRGCGHMNPTDALACRKCGKTNLSEPSGSYPIWLTFIKIFFWLIIILFIIGLIKAMLMNWQSFAMMAVCIGLVYTFMPETAKKYVKKALCSIKALFLKKDSNI